MSWRAIKTVPSATLDFQVEFIISACWFVIPVLHHSSKHLKDAIQKNDMIGIELTHEMVKTAKKKHHGTNLPQNKQGNISWEIR